MCFSVCNVRLRRFFLCGLLGLACASLKQSALAADINETLPLKKVVLFHSGVGYFEHRGEVDGDMELELAFHQSDVNDLLKSMVVQDADGGRIAAVSYPSRDVSPLSHLAVDLSADPSLGDLLQQLRGEQAIFEVDQPLTGKIFGVERREMADESGAMELSEIVTLLTDKGLVRFALDDARTVRLTNKQLDAELREALAIVAAARRGERRNVRLEFTGQGKRQVRVGYLRETPVWKTSYRLVLNEEKLALLQGWAIVENTGETDWSQVELSLVSGRPISFAMDLEQPIFVRRPLVELEVFGAIDPQQHGQDLADLDRNFRRMRGKGQGGGVGFGGFGAGGGAFGGGGFFGTAPAEMPQAAPIDPRAGVETVATAADVGDLLHYQIDHPVSLSAHRSAMLPIVTSDIETERLSIFVSSAHAKHPLRGVKLTNSTGVDLIQGPVTVFDAGAYAGDARLGNCRTTTSQLLSYALDVEAEIDIKDDARRETLLSVTIRNQRLELVHRQEETKNFTVRNSSKAERVVLLETSRHEEWQLKKPAKPAESTERHYRFRVSAQPGQEAMLAVVTQHDEKISLALVGLASATRDELLASKVVPEEVKQTLRTIAALEAEVREATKLRDAAQVRKANIISTQSRIRSNMEKLDSKSQLYLRYVTELTQQEDQLAKLQHQIEEQDARLEKLSEELQKFGARDESGQTYSEDPFK